ncbi:hypothetical protein EPUL_002673 [Erysiphe pulchra]|uniref:Clr5 domain-containing protein n=1 Tax=Erysiphe pulchra TaxID=225359 RepID=A0A2S4PZB5_9PEZI|nr:hypothetical protein EPUL_002673 [Erysiphe pulchra]
MTTNDTFPLPSLAQCESLTDEQCRKIMDYQDPEGIRAQKGWEPSHQPELIRQYMTMRSFTQIAERMKSKVDWSYKTYSNRYKDWLFPVDRNERETAVRRLYACIMSENDSWNVGYNRAASELSFTPQSRLPQRRLRSYDTHDLVADPLSQFSPTESLSTTGYGSDTIYDDVFDDLTGSFVNSSMWSPMPIYNETNNIQYPILSPSIAAGPITQFSDQSPSFSQDFRIESVKHDPNKGLWNQTLHVIPCHKDHSSDSWNKQFSPCPGCGFSQCHALMINARSIDIDTFREFVSLLGDSARSDYAGNYPISYLMAARVGLDYFKSVLWDIRWSTFGQNSFSQSPLHVLNPQDLGDELVDLLKLCSHSLSLRDSMCRTLLHYLFLYPLKRGNYIRVLQSFPNAAHHLQAFDTSGKRITQVMQEAIESKNQLSKNCRDGIIIGLQEIERFISSSPANIAKIQPYNYTDIARGVFANAGVDLFPPTYEYPIYLPNTHSKSHYDQMMCACNNGGIDRNAPDKDGWTAAHLIVTHIRCSNDSTMRRETPEETEQLFRLLVFNSNLREALHVRDPHGNSLVYNIATRGHSGILKYVLELEDEGRRRSMVNFVGKTKSGQKRSVRESVEVAIANCKWNLNNRNYNTQEEEDRLIQLRHSFYECKRILEQWGAESKPSVKKQWRVY